MSITGAKRKSRFEDVVADSQPEQKKIAVDVSAAAARAAEISRELSSKVSFSFVQPNLIGMFFIVFYFI